MRISYYPGCSLHSTAREYDASTKVVCNALGIELAEVEDWNCCGASSGHATSPYLQQALPLRNLVLAEQQGDDLLVPCAACYQNLKLVDYQAKRGAIREIIQDLKEITGHAYQGSIMVRHPLELFQQKDHLNSLRQKVTRPLAGLCLAPYYGCYLVRPGEVVAFDDPEQPEALARILIRLGAGVTDWSYQTDCCGGSLALTKTDLAVALVSNLVDHAREAGAEALVTACPMCMANLDTRQNAGPAALPVFYITELMALAMGINQDDWWAKHLVDPVPLLRQKRLI
ncbi:MAG: CoB--CoM heterodisulfide reductase iron-sulfur subunit B family protein [Heliobacteriaceae bacterium]|nr:CoB--CoM heterodisulfide reductase iron-sulfur subunit B family protein [Heliobacteriaceae bacterium]MDD4586824.1 CoB--CoM heterodisulfide reductase iron-sulfur subunit B family protein [Heliobacteriaceae bacterium]